MASYGSIDSGTPPHHDLNDGQGRFHRRVTPPTRPSTSSSMSTDTLVPTSEATALLPPSPSPSALKSKSIEPPLHLERHHDDELTCDERVPRPASVHSWLAETLQSPCTTPFLLTITFSTAILDSMTYNRFQTFASNQTGNTVFLALSALHAGQRKLKLTFTSFAGFVSSGLLFGQLGAYFGHRRRAWILVSLVFQIVVLSLFTALAAPNLHPEFEKNGRYEWVLMLLAAVQSGPQVTMGTNIDSLMPTAMLTSPIAGLLSDPDLFSLRRAPTRDKRLVYVITFIIGAHVGLATDIFLSPWTTAIIALCLKAVAFVIAVKIPGTRTSVLKREAEQAARTT